MPIDCWIAVDRNIHIGPDQISILKVRHISTDIISNKKRLYNFSTFGVFSNQMITSSQINYKCFIESGKNASSDFSFGIVFQSYATGSQFIQNYLLNIFY